MREFAAGSLLAALVLTLGACGGGGGNNAQAAASGNGAAPANAAAANLTGPAPVAGVTRDFLIGSWATESCDPPAAVYAADGTTDGGRRNWQLEGDRLVVSRGGEREQSVVERLGDDRMRLNTSDGAFELRRCPATQP